MTTSWGNRVTPTLSLSVIRSAWDTPMASYLAEEAQFISLQQHREPLVNGGISINASGPEPKRCICRRHFQMHFLEWMKLLYLEKNFSLFLWPKLTTSQECFRPSMGRGETAEMSLAESMLIKFSDAISDGVTKPKWVNDYRRRSFCE